MYTLNINAIIYALKGDPDAFPIMRDIFADGSIPIYVSTVTEVEPFRYPRLEADEATLIEHLLKKVTRVSLDSQIARVAAMLCRRYNVKLLDSMIAASALYNKSTLLTRNVADFERVPGLQIQKI